MLHEQVSAACSTPSGRLLTGTVSGSESAPPVLYIAGAATGRSMRFGVSALVAGKMRLLTMDRPGLGGSTHDPGRTVKSTAEDYRIFATSVLGLERPFSVVANSQGALFGLAMAAAGWTAHLTHWCHRPMRWHIPLSMTSFPRTHRSWSDWSLTGGTPRLNCWSP
ncbi:alpha/beta hydrolase [Brachybacterium sp. Z12]|uniref:alpha/beta fold hydrolase n=1 Tax=Brachybacterium sp. Z12 TaxID=2759167 RepID=UPI001860E966|nr:alpha/beta hydrolase [Brachybacterium sp. Z12]QNN82864.1 alpha/beta hydrolase [Brachybacterium sp. Z12]